MNVLQKSQKMELMQLAFERYMYIHVYTCNAQTQATLISVFDF